MVNDGSEREFLAETTLVFLRQLGAELGVRNRNQALCTLTQRLATQLCHAVLGHNVVYVAPAGRYRRTGLSASLRSCSPLVLGRRMQRNDRTPALGQVRAAHEVHLAANAGDLPQADRLCTNLALQVYLNAGIDRYHVGRCCEITAGLLHTSTGSIRITGLLST